MRDRVSYEYALVRVVPRVERGECMNAGVMVICRQRRFLAARVGLDEARLRAFAPFLDDASIDQIRVQLDLIPRICAGDRTAGPIAALGLGERWHWLAAPASTIVQPGPVHTGICSEPGASLDRLFSELVDVECVK